MVESISIKSMNGCDHRAAVNGRLRGARSPWLFNDV